MASIGDMRVWWIPQVPGTPFYVPVKDSHEAMLILDVLARYDSFQFENKIKPDYCNAGGLEVFEAGNRNHDDEWCEWHDPDTDQDIDEMMRERPCPTSQN